MTTSTTTVEIYITTHDPEDDELGTDGEDDDNYSSSLAKTTGPRNGGSGTVAVRPDTYVLDGLGVFNSDGGVVFNRDHVRVTLERYGTLSDGRVLLTVAEALPLPTHAPRPGDEGA